MNCAAQSSKDTLCFPTNVVRGLLIDAQRKDILEDEVNNLNERIADLKLQLTKDSVYSASVVASMRREIVQLEGQKSLVLDELGTLKKQLRRARRGQRWTAIAGVITTVGAAILIK